MSTAGGHEREVDPVTGYDTTGHDWNGIKELNTPFPKIVLVFLLIAFLYSVVAWILLPAWPTGRDYTRGLLGLDQGQAAVKGFEALGGLRQGWMARFDQPDFAALADDPALMAEAMPAAARLFADNCAACHGTGGTGGPGFPVLADHSWLWGGDPGTVAETIRVGINSTDPDARYAEMPSFAGLAREDREALARHVAALPSGTAEKDGPAAALFADNCAACHGDAGDGGLMNGAPSLTDTATIYGQDEATVAETLQQGRRGEMPSWKPRLGPAEINLLALYVTRLGGAEAGQ
ncbi:cytochrome-c oxidase, cbb3-type subunit III [Albidovulum sp.]|uniref:cytochrome-c oxidase, cbb3-type subunit III n=1 Tax=Albidovulum sp. TaxID=1872424 RepID=UPI0039B8BFF2